MSIVTHDEALSALGRRDAYETLEDYITQQRTREAEQKAEIERLKDDLRFVERWANHHGQNQRNSPTSILSCIQHYPPILEITRSYADGKVPETRNPYAEIERLREALQEIALAGMSPSPEMSENGVEAWHARQAWRFIGIAARAISPDRAALNTEGAKL